MKYIYVLLLIIISVGCAEKPVLKPAVITIDKKEYISDLIEIPQNVSIYSRGIHRDKLSNQSKFEKEYFRVWNLDKFDIELKHAMWAHSAFRYGNSYGENLKPHSKDFFDHMLENANFSLYGTVNQRAISLELLNIRAFPTDKPLLRDPNKAGEGFPFDYLQNSTVAANKPLFISHYSKNKKWVFVESSFAFGWVKSNEIVTMKKKYTDIWQNAEQIFITKEGQGIYSKDNKFLFNSRVGMMLALISEDNDSYTVLSISKYKNNKPLYLQSKISKEISHKGIMNFNDKNINKIINELLQSNYGWGGMYGQRDCSSTLRDFYTAFGIWLPRNSYKQSKVGDFLSLKNLSNKEKIKLIKKNAVPFETLLYKKGHIVLYVGIYNKKIIILQNVWGVKTKENDREGRFIIGKVVFSSLEIGKNLKFYDNNASLLKNLKSLNIVTK